MEKPVLTGVLPLDVLNWKWNSLNVFWGDKDEIVELFVWLVIIRLLKRYENVKVFYFSEQLNVDLHLLERYSQKLNALQRILFAQPQELFDVLSTEYGQICILRGDLNGSTIRFLRKKNFMVFNIARTYVDIYENRVVVPQWRSIRQWGDKMINVEGELDELMMQIFGEYVYTFRLFFFSYPRMIELPTWKINIDRVLDYNDWDYKKELRKALEELRKKEGLRKWLRQDLDF